MSRVFFCDEGFLLSGNFRLEPTWMRQAPPTNLTELYLNLKGRVNLALGQIELQPVWAAVSV